MFARGVVLIAVSMLLVTCCCAYPTVAGAQDGVAPAASSWDSAPLGSRSGFEPRWAVPSRAEERSRAVLAKPVRLHRFATPLREILWELGKSHEIPIMLDHRAFDELRLATDTPVTISVKDISLRSALSTMLRPLDLTAAIVDEVLLITSMDESLEGNFQKIRIYPASDLVEDSPYGPDYDSLIVLITTVIEPDSWTDAGGVAVIDVFRGALVVSTTDDLHYQIERLLATLREVVLDKGSSQRSNRVNFLAAAGRTIERRRKVSLWQLDSSGNVVWASGHPW